MIHHPEEVNDRRRIIIAHRANLNGPDPSSENKIESIRIALRLGYDVEVDAWCSGDDLWLGHDKPEIKIAPQIRAWLFSLRRIWWHAKDEETLSLLLRESLRVCGHVFFHSDEAMVMTSLRFVWTYPGHADPPDRERWVCVLPESVGVTASAVSERWAGVCTDFPTLHSFSRSKQP